VECWWILVLSRCHFFFIFKHSWAQKRSWKIIHGGPGKSWILFVSERVGTLLSQSSWLLDNSMDTVNNSMDTVNVYFMTCLIRCRKRAMHFCASCAEKDKNIIPTFLKRVKHLRTRVLFLTTKCCTWRDISLQQLSEMVADFQKSYKKCACYVCLFNFILHIMIDVNYLTGFFECYWCNCLNICILSFMWVGGLVVSALEMWTRFRVRIPGRATIPLGIATLGKLFTHIDCLPSFSAPRNWGTKGSFWRLSGYGVD